MNARRGLALRIAVAAPCILHSIFCIAAAEPEAARILWSDGTWDDSGAPCGNLLTRNPRWFGDHVFTGVTYEWETAPTWPQDVKTSDGVQVPANRLFNGFSEPYYPENGCVGREGEVPIVAVFDFKRPCTFTEIDLISLHCTNATGFVEFSDDKAAWRCRREFATASAITRVRFGVAVPSQESPLREGGGPERAGGSTASGRYMRLSFQATQNAVDDWYRIGRRGYTYLDEVYVWGNGEVSAEYPEAIVPISPGTSLLFTNAASGAVSILPMPIPHLDRKPSGATPGSFPLTMARNETETRYFAIVNGTATGKEVALSATGFDDDVRAELLIGGAMQMAPSLHPLSPEEMLELAANDEYSINQDDSENLDILPFFFAESRPKENFLRRYLANPAQVAGFPEAVPLAPGEGCVVMLRLTTDGAAPGARDGVLQAMATGAIPADVTCATLPISLMVADLTLPQQSMWIYAYEPFSRQYPFESVARIRRDAERYAGIGATTTKLLPEPGTKESVFLNMVPQASVGCPTWCKSSLYNRVTKGEFDSLTEAELARIAADARAFLDRGRELGLPDVRICAFLPDEPGVGNGKSVMSLARLMKTAAPELSVHCDPLFFNGGNNGFATTAEIKDVLLPEYNEFVDISCPISYISTRDDAMRDLWLKPRRVNAMYNHPAGRTGSGMIYTCHRYGFNGLAYYCYCRPGIEVWDINSWKSLNLNYQAVMPLGEDVALTPLYEFLREGAETSRMLDALKADNRNDILADVLERSKTAWDRTHFQYNLKDPAAEDILALRETIISAFSTIPQRHKATYSYDDAQAAKRTLYVYVPGWVSETFDVTYMDATVTNIVKRGDGTLQVTSDTLLTAYTFDIRVEDGIFKFAGKLALGTRTAANAGTITVCDGATIQNTSAAGNAGIGANWTTHVIGEGHNGMGALYKNNYSYGGPFGKWVLDGDAKVVMFSGAQDNMYPVDLKGHILDLHLQSGWFIEVSRIENGGEIRVHGNPAAASNYTRFRNWNGFYGGAENLISFSNTTWQIENMRQYLTATPGLDWSMAFEDKSAMRIVAGTYKGGTLQTNSWNGPVEIRRGMLPVSVPADKGELGFAFKGAVSGGGFDLQGLDTTTLALRLANSGNTFTNGITGQYADLRLAANGALPAAGGSLALTNSTVTLEDSSAAWSLPAAEFSGTGSVSGGRGAWASLAKTGAGTLAYDSTVGGPTLDIAEGSVDFTSLTNRTAFAGLVEGRKHLTQGSSASDRYVVYQMAASWRGSTATNAITQGTRLLYDWTKDPNTGWTTNLLLSYEGYIWNNSPTNELWAFAGGGAEDSDWRLNIDGQTAVGKCIWSNTKAVCFCDGIVAGNFAYDLHTNMVVMTPGPHRFEYRHAISLTAKTYGLNYCWGISGYGNYKDTLEEPKYEKWRAACGLMFNRTGKCTRDIADYEELIDPGDGSLLTWDIPPASGTASHPITGEAVSLTPVFDSLRMGPGTTILVPDGSTWTFADVEGWPTVVGGSVAVTDTFTTDGENFGRASFTIDGTLAFSPGARLVPPGVDVRPPDMGRAGEYVLGTATGGISGAPGAGRNSRWKVFVDGNAIKAICISEHTMMMVR